MSEVQEPFETTAAPEVAPEPQDVEAKDSKAIAVSDQGFMVPTDHRQLKSILKTISDGGGMPKRFDTVPKMIAAYNLGVALMGNRWQLAVNNMAPIHGQMMIYGELPRTLAEQTKEVTEFRVYVIDKEYKEINTQNKNLDAEPYAAVCEVQRNNRHKNQFTYSLEEARAAGQYPPMKYDKKTNKQVPNEDSPWAKWTKVMLMRKAQALGVKFTFPEALAGAKIAEYDADELPDYAPIKDVTPKEDKAAMINERFKQ